MRRKNEQPFLPFDAPEPRPEPPPEPPPDGSPLITALARACVGAPLKDKILVAPSLFVGNALVERLAREGHPWMNLRVETVRTLALRLVERDLAHDGLRVLSRAQALALVEQACGECLTANGYFAALRDRPGFHRALQRTFEELRGAGIPAADLPAKAFADRRKRDELRRILARYEETLAASSWIDRADVIRRALEASRAGRRLPGEALFLAPRGLEHSGVESALLAELSEGRLETLETEPADAWIAKAAGASLFRATGEENEIREVFRRVLSARIPFDDVEIVATDSRLYAALAWELSREHGVPCTFSAGIGAAFTRPGQSALAFLDWIADGFGADSLRRVLASAAVTLTRLPGGGPDAPGARAAGRALREARVGWGAARHHAALDRLIAELSKPDEGGREDDDAGEDERRERGRRRERRLEAARRARAFVGRALELAACADGASCDLRALARGTRAFVTGFARVTDPLDGAALTGLQALLEELELLAPAALAPTEAAARLADAVRGLSVESDRARAGRIHVSDVAGGGWSGRRHAFLVGLDEERHPGADLEDPVLLDAERREINRALAPAALSLFRDRPRDAARALESCVARSAGPLTASYSSWKLRSLDQQSEQFPSPFFLEIHRAASGQPRADYTDLADALPSAAGFSPGPHAALDETEWWLSGLTPQRGASGGSAAEAVAALYPHLREGRRAEEARASVEFTVYDGWVRGGTPELDPRAGGAPQSASRLQLLAACPFRFFVRHVLGVEAPETAERDRTRWLDPLMAGSLLHDAFRLFFERITAPRREADRRRACRAHRGDRRGADRPLARTDPSPKRDRVCAAARGAALRVPHLSSPRGGALPRGHPALLRGALRPAARRAAGTDREPRARDDRRRRRALFRASGLDRPNRRGSRRRLPGLGLQDGRGLPVLGGARRRRRPEDSVRALCPRPRSAARTGRAPRSGVAVGVLLSGTAGRGAAIPNAARRR